MKKNLTLLLIACSLQLYGQESDVLRLSIANGEAHFDYGKCYIKKDTSLFTGILYENYQAGRIYWEKEYKDGYIEGLDKSWYESGNPMHERFYKDKKID